MLRYFTGTTAIPSSSFTTKETYATKETVIQSPVTGLIGFRQSLSGARFARRARAKVAHQAFIFGAVQNSEIKLLLARHGRTEWNHSGRYQGRSDPPLSVEGTLDAAALVGHVAGEHITAIVTSPLRRAVQTATIVADRLGAAPVRVDPRLVEIAYGAWEGLTQTEVKARWPDELRRWKDHPESTRFPGGETLEEARRRLFDSLVDLTALPSGTTCLVVMHSGLIRLALIQARGLQAAAFRRIPVEPGSISRLRLQTTQYARLWVVPDLGQKVDDGAGLGAACCEPGMT